jgi:hypothetical protein
MGCHSNYAKRVLLHIGKGRGEKISEPKKTTHFLPIAEGAIHLRLTLLLCWKK